MKIPITNIHTEETLLSLLYFFGLLKLLQNLFDKSLFWHTQNFKHLHFRENTLNFVAICLPYTKLLTAKGLWLTVTLGSGILNNHLVVRYFNFGYECFKED
jgi:hypothetical protein